MSANRLAQAAVVTLSAALGVVAVRGLLARSNTQVHLINRNEPNAPESKEKP